MCTKVQLKEDKAKEFQVFLSFWLMKKDFTDKLQIIGKSTMSKPLIVVTKVAESI